jgi:glycosyltransferase involved in cell wall biosynthesis
MKNILIIAYSDLENDPRVHRQVSYLRQYYHISTVGWEPLLMDDVQFYRMVPRIRSRWKRLKDAADLKLMRYHKHHWTLYDFEPLIDALSKQTFDLIIANDAESLPFAFEIAGDTPVIGDLHEYSPAQFDHSFKWRFLYKDYNEYLCRTYLKQCAHLFTVSEGIALKYQTVFGALPDVLTNAPEFQDLNPSPTGPDEIRIIHHGCAQPSRKIERMIEVMKHADSRFSLTLMLVAGDEQYIEDLKKMSAEMDNVRFVPPVPMIQIPEVINHYDIGIHFLEPINFNYKNALPNKIFEFIQARLALLIGPTPGMAAVVREYGCGVITDTFNPHEIGEVLNRITIEEIDRYKQKSHQTASVLNAEENMKKLHKMAERVLLKHKLSNRGKE